ncbi:hypothetical protein [Paenarthrobacter ureafaciens]|uniref:hypothetical protein n=1 Tax=Paenarthrobacter ureafaciens TaxID=37931 RepID=UPI003D3248B7
MGDTTGWYIWAGDFSEDPDFLFLCIWRTYMSGDLSPPLPRASTRMEVPSCARL